MSEATARTRARPQGRPRTAPRRETAPRRHLRSVPSRPVRTRGRRRVRPQVALTTAIGAFFLVLFGVALLQTVLVQGQIHLDGLRADLASRQAEAQELRAEVARLSSPEAIVAWAEAHGLVDPGVTTYLLPPPPEPASVARTSGTE